MTSMHGWLVDHLRAAVDAVDEVFEEGYSASNPGLVGSCLQAYAIDAVALQLRGLGTGDAATAMGALEFVGVALEKIADAITSSDNQNIADAIDAMPTYGYKLEQFTEAIDRLTQAFKER
jgi:hypothetical protein